MFSGNIQSKCSFEIFREEHYHMTLSNKTPPLRKHDMLRLFFETAISQNSSKWLHVRNLYLFSYPNKFCCCNFFQNTGKSSWRPERNSSIHPKMFYNKADLKNSTKHSLERKCNEVLFSVRSRPATLTKRNPITVIFWWLLQGFS